MTRVMKADEGLVQAIFRPWKMVQSRENSFHNNNFGKDLHNHIVDESQWGHIGADWNEQYLLFKII